MQIKQLVIGSECNHELDGRTPESNTEHTSLPKASAAVSASSGYYIIQSYIVTVWLGGVFE